MPAPSRLRVLFVVSGNSSRGVSSFIVSQAKSLMAKGVEVDYFPVKGKGLSGYVKAAGPLRKQIKEGNYTLIHAHYVLCAMTAVLSRSGLPLVVSLMGSDVYGDFDEKGKRMLNSYPVMAITQMLQPFFKQIIVKSPNLGDYIYLKKRTHLLPNGVNMKDFNPVNRVEARKTLGLDPEKKYVLFMADPANKRKNVQLAEDAVNLLQSEGVTLLKPFPVKHEQVCAYISAADVLISSSYNEGSPNIVKEAMSCNAPVVSTDVGDVKWLFGNTPGYYLTGYTPEETAKKLSEAIAFRRQHDETKGRERLVELGLDSQVVADKLINIYNLALNS